jgi:hypothetical protein
MLNHIATIWCRYMHSEPMWPMHGRYYCRVCLRSHPVPWEQKHFPRRELRVVEITAGGAAARGVTRSATAMAAVASRY